MMIYYGIYGHIFIVSQVCLPVVHVSLGAVFDEGDPELDIGAVGEEVQPDDDTGEGEDQDDHHKQEDDRQQAQAQPGHSLTRALYKMFFYEANSQH